MTKPETAKYLSGLGYSAKDEDVGIIIYVNRPMGHGKKERVRNILRSVGYKGKWGWKLKNSDLHKTRIGEK